MNFISEVLWHTSISISHMETVTVEFFFKYEYLLSDLFLTSGKGYLKSYDTLIAYANTRYMNSQCSVWYLDQFLLKNHINICLLKFQTTCTGTFFICEFL